MSKWLYELPYWKLLIQQRDERRAKQKLEKV